MPARLFGSRRSLSSAGSLATVPPVSSVLTDLAAYYKFDADGADSTANANHLTLLGAPTFPAGKIGNGMLLVLTASQYAQKASVATLFTGGKSFHIWFWLKPTTVGAVQALVTRSNSSNTNMEFQSYLSATGRVTFDIKDLGGVLKSVTANTFGALAAGTWYFVEMKCDLTAAVIAVAVNNGAYDTTVLDNGGTVSKGVSLSVGIWDNLGAGGGDFIIDELGFRIGSVLTAAQRTALYAGGAPGAGQTYPFTGVP